MRESTLLGLTRDLGVQDRRESQSDLRRHRQRPVPPDDRPGKRGRDVEDRAAPPAQAVEKRHRFRAEPQRRRHRLGPAAGPFDDFVETVFGVHGPQVLKDLHVIEQWIDPESDLGENVARLSSKTALDLLRHATGFDAAARFDEAKAVVLDALKKWDALPSGVAAATWQFLSKSTPAGDAERFKAFLEALASLDAETRSRALTEALEERPGRQAGIAMAPGDCRPGAAGAHPGSRPRERARAEHARGLERRCRQAPSRLHRLEPRSGADPPGRRGRGLRQAERMAGQTARRSDQQEGGPAGGSQRDPAGGVRRRPQSARGLRNRHQGAQQALHRRLRGDLPAHDRRHRVARRLLRPLEAGQPCAVPPGGLRRRSERAAPRRNRRRRAQQGGAQPRDGPDDACRAAAAVLHLGCHARDGEPREALGRGARRPRARLRIFGVRQSQHRQPGPQRAVGARDPARGGRRRGSSCRERHHRVRGAPDSERHARGGPRAADASVHRRVPVHALSRRRGFAASVL